MKHVNALPSVLCGRELMAMQIQYDMSFKKALQKIAEEFYHLRVMQGMKQGIYDFRQVLRTLERLGTILH